MWRTGSLWRPRDYWRRSIIVEDFAMSCQCNQSQAVDVARLKQKVIQDFNILVRGLNKGYKYDYSIIMNEISFIESYQNLDNQQLIYEYYLNHGM